MNKSESIIFNSSNNNNIYEWRVVDDVVMGGRSSGRIMLSKKGVIIYSGEISLENNGGFSSLRHRFFKTDISSYAKMKIRLKGDGKDYQFRIKISSNDSHSYVSNFKTVNDWQIVEVNLSEMYPAFRGKKLDMPNFSTNTIEKIAFLIGNKKNESFLLEIDKIYLE